jgi:hypothetical protein
MSRRSAGPLAILGLHLVCLIVASTRAAQVVAGAGALVALGLLILSWFPSGSVRADLFRGFPDLSRSHTRTFVLLLLPFVLPVASHWFAPRLGFWRLDGRTQVIVAWLVVLVALAAMGRAAGSPAGAGRPAQAPAPRYPPLLTMLFGLWAALLWLTVVWDVGVGRVVMSVPRLVPEPCAGDVLTNILRTWESHPASEHLFLAWRTPDSFARKVAYANHVHPFLLLMYGTAKLAQAVTGSALAVGVSFTPFLSALAMLLAFGALLARSGPIEPGASLRWLLSLFLGLGFLLTGWRLWNDLYRYCMDSSLPLVGSLAIVVWACLRPPIRPRAALAAACAFAALAPTYVPILVLAMACLFARRSTTVPDAIASNRALVFISGAAILVGLGVYLLPRVLIAWKGYTASESTFLFRSGLDGDVQYFTGILQAFVRPCSVGCCADRPFGDLVLPAFVPVVACWLWGLRGQRTTRLRLASQSVFVSAPYVFSLFLFPQSVSIHPYLYDHLLLVPAAVMGAWATLLAPVQRRLRGATLLAYLLLMGGLIMANLVGIAQGMVRLPW